MNALVAEARSWLGTPYVHQASLKGIGADCIGFVAGVAGRCGVLGAAAWWNDPRRRAYAPRPDGGMLLTVADEYLDRQPPGTPYRQADVVVLRFTHDPQHFAIVAELEPVTILHSYASAGKVVENNLAPLWSRRVVAHYRFRTL